MSVDNLGTIKVPIVCDSRQVATLISVAALSPPVTPAAGVPFVERSR